MTDGNPHRVGKLLRSEHNLGRRRYLCAGDAESLNRGPTRVKEAPRQIEEPFAEIRSPTYQACAARRQEPNV